MVKSTRQIIVTCDDCGLSEGINLATLQLFQKEMATTATVMANFPFAKHALELFSEHAIPDIGVHLTLSDGVPLTDIKFPSSLTRKNGSFRHKYLLFLSTLMASKKLRQKVKNELRLQVEFFLENNIAPRHLTTHSHFHGIPSLREIIFDLAHEYGITWVRSHRYSSALVPKNPFFRVKTPTILAEDAIYSGSFQMPDYIVGLKWWMPYKPEVLVSRIMSLEGVIEIAVHPCIAEDDTYPNAVLYTPQQRHQEMKYFEAFFERLNRHHKDEITLKSL